MNEEKLTQLLSRLLSKLATREILSAADIIEIMGISPEEFTERCELEARGIQTCMTCGESSNETPLEHYNRKHKYET